MTDEEFKEYIEYDIAVSIKNTEAIFDYIKRNIEINEQIRKEKEELLSYIRNRKPKIEQLRLFKDETDHRYNSEIIDYEWEWRKRYIVLRTPAYINNKHR